MAWTNGLTDMVMPYMIQFLRDYTSKVDLLLHERKEAQVGRGAGARRHMGVWGYGRAQRSLAACRQAGGLEGSTDSVGAGPWLPGL